MSTINSRRSRRLRSLVVAIGAVAVGASLPSHADPKFGRLISFGDSWADSTINLLPILVGAPATYPSMGTSPADLAGNEFIPYPYWLQQELELANGNMVSYAIGGSTSSTMNITGVPYSLPYQLATWGGRAFGPNDLVTLSIGGNDVFRESGLAASTPGNPDGLSFNQVTAVDFAESVSDNIQSAVTAFSNAGARTLLISASSDFSGVPGAAPAMDLGAFSVYGEHLYQGIQEKLRPLALSGTRIFLMDMTLFVTQLGDNLDQYGFKSYLYDASAQPSVWRPDGYHLNSQGYALMAQYMSNILSAPYSQAQLSRIAQASASSFSHALLNRINNRRSITSDPEESPFTLYAMGTYNNSSLEAGEDYSTMDKFSSTGTIGGDLQLSSDLRAGFAYGYENNNVDLFQDNDVDGHSNHIASYISYYDGAWFGDALLGYSWHNLDLKRSGILQDVKGDTEATTFTIATRGGYLFDLGAVQAGPIAGLSYSKTKVDSFRETGDALLTYQVDSQEQESTIGEVGVQLRASLLKGEHPIDGYVDLTWQHEFGDRDRTVTTALTQSPLLPIQTDVRDFESRGQAMIGGGVLFTLSDALSVGFGASSLIDNGNGNGYQISSSLDYRF
ncbi:TPA: autotransporter domain-containing protein [Pseudomonas aeruginosa]